MAPQAFKHFGQNSLHVISLRTDGAAPGTNLAARIYWAAWGLNYFCFLVLQISFLQRCQEK